MKKYFWDDRRSLNIFIVGVGVGIVVLLPHQVFAATYYVSPTGSDNNVGTLAAPWKTLQANTSKLLPGDTMNVQSGSYTGFVVGWDGPNQGTYSQIAGTAGNPITIQADPSATPGSVIINVKNPKTQVGIDLEPGCDYITIKGFVVDALNSFSIYPNKGNGIKATGNGDQVINNVVRNLDYSVGGIVTNSADNVVIQDNDVSQVHWHSNGNYGHGIYIANGNGLIVRNNSIHDNDYIGLHINGDPNTVSNSLIENNLIYNNGQNGINADGLVNSTIRNNLIYGFQNYGIAFYQIDASSSPSGNKIINNTIVSTVSSASGALRIINGATNTIIINNILLGGNNITLRISNDSKSGLVSDYNVVSSSFQSEDTGSSQTLAQWKSSSSQDVHSITATPAQLFVNSAGGDYHLSSTSPAIDMGTLSNAPTIDFANNARPQGSGYDIGGYEYGGSSSSSPTPSPSPSPVPSDTTPPSTPANLVATAISYSQINLSWSASTDNVIVTGYKVFRAGSQVATVSGTTYSDASLSASTSYSYTVLAYDASGNNSSQSSSSSATTQTLPTSGNFSLWSNGTLPTVSAETSDNAAVELGLKFQSSMSGSVTGIRFYKGTTNTGTHVGHLWSSSGTLLATAPFSNETSSGWQQVTLSSPIAITANTTYVVSYYAPKGNYAYNTSFFTSSGFSNSPLTALANSTSGGNGVYKYATGGGFPNQTYQSTNYWVDVVFALDSSGTSPSPTPPPSPTPTPTPPVATSPTITTQPSSQTVTSGQTATFLVVAGGTAPLAYQWQKNGTPISGATTSSYTTPSTTTADNGASFRVVVANSVGSVNSNSITLTVTSTTPPPNTTSATGTTNTADTTPPSAPMVIALPASSSQINLSWDPSTDNVGVVGYKVFRGEQQIADISTTSYQDTGLLPSNPYSYSVVAYDKAGNTIRSQYISAGTLQGSSTIPAVNNPVTPTPNASSLPSTTSTTSSGKFITGEKVTVSALKLNVRDAAGGTTIGSQLSGTSGTVVEGPIAAGGYTWWKVNYTTTTGWSAENYLKKGTGLSQEEKNQLIVTILAQIIVLQKQLNEILANTPH